MKKISNLLWGLIFILLGVVFGLNALGITDINIFFDGWWTLFIIVPCFIGLFNDEDKSGNLIGLIIGACLLLGCLDVVEFEIIWKLMVPFILVAGITLTNAVMGAINTSMNPYFASTGRRVSILPSYPSKVTIFTPPYITACAGL